MSKNLQGSDELLIVSDTRAYRTDSGEIAIFEPTLREIEYISTYMSKIVWILFLCEGPPPKSYRTSITKKIQVLPLQFAGGNTVGSKLKVLQKLTGYFGVIHSAVRKFNLIHTRGPSVPAWIAIVLSFFYKHKKFWNKYAGNWYQKNPSKMYAMQIRLLKKAAHTRVTINGVADPAGIHIIPFENPCFSDDEFKEALEASHTKKYAGPYILLFVGRVEDGKGIFRLIEAVSAYRDPSIFEHIYFAGDGKDMEKAGEMAKWLPVPYSFLGSLSRESLNEYYRQAHFLILPTLASEGFPKVVAEAAAFGCIPVVSDISAIGKYVNNFNGCIWPYKTISFTEYFNTLPFGAEQELKSKAIESVKIARQFTYHSYWEKLKQEVL